MNDIQTLGAEAGLGMLLGAYNDWRQRKQQARLQALQIRGQKEMGIFNREQAMQMWKDTNYAAQRREMEKAGLNIGLMYGSAGSGGTTQGAGGGNVTGGQAPTGGGEVGMAMQLGMQLQLLKAQKENIQADTKLKLSGVPKTEAETTETLTNIDAIKAGIENTKTQGKILQWEEKLKSIEAGIKEMTMENAIKQIQSSTEILEAQAWMAVRQNFIDQETYNDKIKQIRQTTTEQQLRMGAIKQGIEVDKATIQKINTEIWRTVEQNKIDWNKLNQGDRDLILKQMAVTLSQGEQAFGQNLASRVKQWTDILANMLNAAME